MRLLGSSSLTRPLTRLHQFLFTCRAFASSALSSSRCSKIASKRSASMLCQGEGNISSAHPSPAFVRKPKRVAASGSILNRSGDADPPRSLRWGCRSRLRDQLCHLDRRQATGSGGLGSVSQFQSIGDTIAVIYSSIAKSKLALFVFYQNPTLTPRHPKIREQLCASRASAGRAASQHGRVAESTSTLCAPHASRSPFCTEAAAEHANLPNLPCEV